MGSQNLFTYNHEQNILEFLSQNLHNQKSGPHRVSKFRRLLYMISQVVRSSQIRHNFEYKIVLWNLNEIHH
jgi:hypothetical protein